MVGRKKQTKTTFKKKETLKKTPGQHEIDTEQVEVVDIEENVQSQSPLQNVRDDKNVHNNSENNLVESNCYVDNDIQHDMNNDDDDSDIKIISDSDEESHYVSYNEKYNENHVITDHNESNSWDKVPSDHNNTKMESVKDEMISSVNANKKNQEPGRTRLFLKPIPLDATAEDIREFFQNKGFSVTDSYVPLKKGKAKGYGFVGFSTDEEAKRAVQITNCDFKGCRMTLAYATGKEFSRSDDEKSNVLFLRNLPKSCTSDMLKKYFPKHKEIRLMTSDSGGCRGIAFVEFYTLKESTTAKTAIGELIIDGRKIGIEYAQPKTERKPRSYRRMSPPRSGYSSRSDYMYDMPPSYYRPSYDFEAASPLRQYDYGGRYYDRDARYNRRINDSYGGYYFNAPPLPPISSYYYDYSPDSYRYSSISHGGGGGGHTNPSYYRSGSSHSRHLRYNREIDYRRSPRK